MIRLVIRQVVAPVVALVLGFGLTGCGTGFGAETVQVYDAGAGVNARGGGVDVLNALVVDNGDETGTLSVSLLDKLGDGDEVAAIEATVDDQPLEVSQSVQPIRLCPGRLLVVGPDATVTLGGDGFAAGGTLTLSMTFRDAAPLSLDVPVVARSAMYDGIAETPAAEPPTPVACPPTTSG